MQSIRPRGDFPAEGNSQGCIVSKDGLIKHVELHVGTGLQEGSPHSDDARVGNIGVLFQDASSAGNLVKPIIPRGFAPIASVLFGGDRKGCNFVSSSTKFLKDLN